MVAGRVKAAMGFHSNPKAPKSPAPAEGHTQTPARAPPSSSSSSSPATASKASSAFARSLGAYFPRSSSQVQPARAPPEVAGLLRAIEQLQERESRLRVELLEQKILKETVAIVPFLEAELAAKSGELEKCKEAAARLESENMRLCAELDAAVLEVTSRKQRIVQMENEMTELRKQQQEALAADADDCCSSSASASVGSSGAAANPAGSAQLGAEPSAPPPMQRQTPAFMSKSYSVSLQASPPSSPSSSPFSSTSTSPMNSGSSSDTAAAPARTRVPELSKLPPIPPPTLPRPPLVPASCSLTMSSSPTSSLGAAPPPPPPPPPSGRAYRACSPAKSGSCVRRVPEVVEFYHSLMRRESKRDGGSGGDAANGGGAAATRDMIGEIENRSAHLLAVRNTVS